MKLISIAFSHYVEKARWALDRFGFSYEDERHMPAFHMPAVLWATKGRLGTPDRVSSRFSTPLLILDDGTMVRDSTDIMRWASDSRGGDAEGLFPDAEVEELDRYLSLKLGPHTRRAVYHEGLADAGLMRRVARNNVSAAEAALFSMAFPLVKQVITRALKVTPERAAASEVKAREVFDAIDRRRAGRPFLVGDRLTAADITFACMAAPLLMPGPELGYAAILPTLDELGPRARALTEEMRAHPSGVFALELFSRHRKVVLDS